MEQHWDNLALYALGQETGLVNIGCITFFRKRIGNPGSMTLDSLLLFAALMSPA